MNAVLQAILLLIEQIAPSASAKVITTIIAALEQVVPFVIQVAKEMAPQVMNIITALRSNSEVTTEQLIQLQAIETQIDANFEEAAKAALAEDAASSQ